MKVLIFKIALEELELVGPSGEVVVNNGKYEISFGGVGRGSYGEFVDGSHS